MSVPLLRAANGMSIPYLGYIELDIELCGQVVSNCGVLVVRDPPGGLCDQIPGVLGMNVLKRCYQGLFGQHGPALFDLPDVSKALRFISQALQYCSEVNTITSVNRSGMVRVRGRRSFRIPGGMVKFVPATCSDEYSNGAVLFEPPGSGLPAGLLAPRR